MRIAITVTSCDQNATADPRFDQAACLALTDDDGISWEFIPNPAYGTSLGSDMHAACAIMDSGAQTVISGHFGHNAFTVLKVTGVEMFLIPVDGSFTAREILDRFRAGSLTRADVRADPVHH